MKNQIKKKQEDLICGKTKEYIRKKFFSQKLGELITEIQSETEITKEENEKLILFLTELKTQEEKNIKLLIETFGGKIVGEKDITPPSVEDLLQGVSDKEWREKADKISNFVNKTLDDLRVAINDTENKKRIPLNYWLDTSITFLSYQGIIDKDIVYKNQLYRAKMTSFIDDFGCSRAESEERAKMTKEYSDYKEVMNLKERIERFEMLAKKYDSKNFYENR